MKVEEISTESDIVDQIRWWAEVASEELSLQEWDANEERPETVKRAFDKIRDLIEDWNDYRRNNHS